MMNKFLDWCSFNDNIFITFFTHISLLLCVAAIIATIIALLTVAPLLGIPAFFGVWYLIYLKYKGEQT